VKTDQNNSRGAGVWQGQRPRRDLTAPKATADKRSAPSTLQGCRL